MHKLVRDSAGTKNLPELLQTPVGMKLFELVGESSWQKFKTVSGPSPYNTKLVRRLLALVTKIQVVTNLLELVKSPAGRKGTLELVSSRLLKSLNARPDKDPAGEQSARNRKQSSW